MIAELATAGYGTRMAVDSPFSDPADRPEASERPDMAGLDRLEDRLLEAVSKQAVTLPAGLQRRWFNDVVVSVAVTALREAAEAGELSQLFDGAAPTGGDLEMVTRVLAELMDAENAGLQAECLAFALGLNVGGGTSQTEIARKHCVRKATVSKRCIRICETFGLPPSRGMKSEDARASYAVRQKGKRARPARVDWPFKGMLTKVYGGTTAT